MTSLASQEQRLLPASQSTWTELRHGWPVVATAMLGITALMLPVHAAGVYMPIWQQEFGWSRAGMATALSLYIAVTSLLAPGIGALVDRLGAQRVALVSMALIIPAYGVFAALQPPLWSLYAAFILVAILGAGTTQVVFCRPIVESFDAARGFALALAQSGTAISLLLAPLLAYALLQVMSWRLSWWALMAVPLLY
ncbi:MAG: MFS transporter [Sphingobium sp.]